MRILRSIDFLMAIKGYTFPESQQSSARSIVGNAESRRRRRRRRNSITSLSAAATMSYTAIFVNSTANQQIHLAWLRKCSSVSPLTHKRWVNSYSTKAEKKSWTKWKVAECRQNNVQTSKKKIQLPSTKILSQQPKEKIYLLTHTHSQPRITYEYTHRTTHVPNQNRPKNITHIIRCTRRSR